MKKVLILFYLLSISLVGYSQSNKDIAKVYIKRAKEAIELSIDYELALSYFEKAMEYTDSITDKNMAILGSRVYFETHHKQESLVEQLRYLEESDKYFKYYFDLSKSKKTEEYIIATEDYVLLIEAKEKLEEEIKEIQAEELRKKLELKRIDSLKAIWAGKSAELSLKVDSVYSFNKNKVALYKVNTFYGLLNDDGETIIEANEYVSVAHFDGYFIFKNLEINPTKLFCYNSNRKVGFLIPSISDFFTLSTHYGRVMLPRGNGRLVTYPNNSFQAFVYDLNVRKVVKVANEKDLFKNLKRSDAIDKSNNDGEVKVNKEWYKFGGHLGGGIHPLYAEEGYTLQGFLCSIDGRFLSAISDYQYIGAFYNGKFEASKGTNRIWINQNGTKVSDAANESEGYLGKAKVVKLEDGSYQIIKDGFIILGNEKLEKMKDFLRKNNTK